MRGATKVNKDLTFRQSKWHFTVSIFICGKKKTINWNVQSFCQPWTKVALYPFSSNRVVRIAKLYAVNHRQQVFLLLLLFFFCLFSPQNVLTQFGTECSPVLRPVEVPSPTWPEPPSLYSAVIGTLKQQSPWTNTVHACAHTHAHTLSTVCLSCFSSTCKWDVYFCL